MPLHQWRSFSRSPVPVPSFPTRVSSPCFIAGSSSSFSSTAQDAGVSTRGLGREKPLLRRRSGSEGWHVRFTMIWLNRYADSVYGIVRLLIGLMFASHGGQKILGFPPSERGLATNPTGLTAGWIELTCGLLIAVGLLTRLAAFIASGEMAVAYFLTSFSGKRSITRRACLSDCCRSRTRASCQCFFASFSSSLFFTAQAVGV